MEYHNAVSKICVLVFGRDVRITEKGDGVCNGYTVTKIHVQRTYNYFRYK